MIGCVTPLGLLLYVCLLFAQGWTVLNLLERNLADVVIIVCCLSTCGVLVLLGIGFARWRAWWCVRGEDDALRDRFYRWGMEGDFPRRPSVKLSLFLLLWGCWSVLLSACLTFPAGDWLSDVGALRLMLLWFFVFGLSFILTARGHGDRLSKVRCLDGLRPVFHRRFPPSEIVSMYEAMDGASAILWREYVSLPDVQVTEVTNRRFRERALPYTLGRSHILQSFGFLMATVAVLVAIALGLPSFLDLVGGGTAISGWWIEFFGGGRVVAP